jgi:hypothetical protein
MRSRLSEDLILRVFISDQKAVPAAGVEWLSKHQLVYKP